MVWKLGRTLYKKVMEKKRCKKGWSSFADWEKFHQKFLSCLETGLFQKKDGSWAHTFLKKTTGISRFVISPLEILDKIKLFIPKKSCKIIWHLLGMKPNSLWFFLYYLDNFSYFLFSPRKFHIAFLQYSRKIQVLE